MDSFLAQFLADKGYSDTLVKTLDDGTIGEDVNGADDAMVTDRFYKYKRRDGKKRRKRAKQQLSFNVDVDVERLTK